MKYSFSLENQHAELRSALRRFEQGLFEKAGEQLGYANAHIERFATVVVESPVETHGFEAVCEKSGTTVPVSPDATEIRNRTTAVPADG